MEPPLAILAEKAQILHLERAWEDRSQYRFQGRGDPRQICRRQLSRQRQVEPEFLHHVWIAPTRQKRLLPQAEPAARRRANSAAPGGARWLSRAENDRSRKRCKPGAVAVGDQRQKAADRLQSEARHLDVPEACGEVGNIGFQAFSVRALGQPEWRFESAMEPVFPRRGGDRFDLAGQAWDVWMRQGRPGHGIPAEPGGCEIGERPRRGGVMDCVALEICHGGPSRRALQRRCDVAVAGARARTWGRCCRPVLTNADIVLDDRVIRGSVVIKDGQIADVSDGISRAPGSVGLGGDLLIPGLIELHTDNIESHIQPRPNVDWPHAAAIMAHDGEFASVGATTVFDAMRLGIIEGGAE